MPDVVDRQILSIPHLNALFLFLSHQFCKTCTGRRIGCKSSKSVTCAGSIANQRARISFADLDRRISNFQLHDACLLTLPLRICTFSFVFLINQKY